LCQPQGNWASQISYDADITSLAQSGDIVYALTDGKLFIYNNSDESLEEYIKESGNTDITHITYNTKNKFLFITRSDANIELLYENKSFENIPDLKNYAGQNIDKTINDIYIIDDLAFLATNFGFVKIDLNEVKIKESGIFNFKLYSIFIEGNSLYAATEKGVYVVDLNKNIQDFSNWNILLLSNLYEGNEEFEFEDNEIKKVIIFKDKLHFFVPERIIIKGTEEITKPAAVYILDNPTTVKMLEGGKNALSFSKTANDHLFIIKSDKCRDYENLTQYRDVNVENTKSIIPNGNKQGEYWLGSAGNNLSLIKTNDSGLEFLKQYIRPFGPASNYPFSQTFGNNQLIITGGGFYTDRFFNPASLSILKDLKWNNITSDLISQESGISAFDLAYAISDPLSPSHIFASSWGEGLYEFENNHLKNRYGANNSTIEEIVLDDYRTTRVGGMKYDKSNNLWLVNSGVESTIKVFQKNGEWAKLYYPEIARQNTNIKDILIDRYSNKWIIAFHVDNFIFIFNDNGTISDTSDDKYKYIYKEDYEDQNGNKLVIQDINCIAEDMNGTIWIGTDIGPFKIYNSSDIYNKSNITLNKVYVDRGTGSGSVIGLLENVTINSIIVDGANRKWIATQTTGVYLLNSEENEVLEHFTMEDTPLPSNNIISLSINLESGIVYFGSDRGLMSYNTGVTTGSENFSNVYVYPNPVRPDYTGIITVKGLKSNSRIKITDVRGNLIVEGTSLGGQFHWNGLNHKGKRVDTGVYLVFGSSDSGSEGVVTKIMIIN